MSKVPTSFFLYILAYSKIYLKKNKGIRIADTRLTEKNEVEKKDFSDMKVFLY